ncbi:hypothetical protein B296_00009574 [Ensete ventricosum]|uniref:Uncharacterized protein n=1 Tax=Ensete ventricosum TaxID=4639 RepID=A0A426Z9R3_ENSVE|nr:hypothetical protein B296_00009574 [Ensete ventricosum]
MIKRRRNRRLRGCNGDRGDYKMGVARSSDEEVEGSDGRWLGAEGNTRRSRLCASGQWQRVEDAAATTRDGVTAAIESGCIGGRRRVAAAPRERGPEVKRRGRAATIVHMTQAHNKSASQEECGESDTVLVQRRHRSRAKEDTSRAKSSGAMAEERDGDITKTSPLQDGRMGSDDRGDCRGGGKAVASPLLYATEGYYWC